MTELFIIAILVSFLIFLTFLNLGARKQIKAGKNKEIELVSKINSLANDLAIQKSNLELKFQSEINSLKSKQVEEIKVARKSAVDTSRAVLKGKISEEIAPFLPNFPYDSSDCKFFGSPIDFIVFEGMSKGNITKIIILDVKTGKSQLSKIQNQIKKCAENGRIEFVKFDPGLPTSS